MSEAIQRTAILAFTAFLLWLFKEPGYLIFLLLLLIARRKDTKRDILSEFDAIHDRLDALTRKRNEKP